ncbi:hypothetical protein ACIPSE_39050 [Streptomyces sp. NPDC090106]|uniref:hypothetical protein n=1 Tax=Streptomyces sp. NPDC090106 TaxID=3365946 RepID=UPI003821CC27
MCVGRRGHRPAHRVGSAHRHDDGRADAHVTESGDDLHVYPTEALPYVAQGTLDRRLFDVSGLVAAGTTTRTATGCR